nr:hypothetical protein [Tanacetum cinerariifolium]
MSSDNAQSVVTYTSISSYLDRPSWGIPLMNAGEFLEMDPYEEVAQQGQAHPLLPAYVKDNDEDPEEDPEKKPNKEHEPEDDDEDLEEDPNKDHEPEDTREPSEEPPRHHGARIYVRPQTPMAASTQALIDAFSAGSSPLPLPPTSPAYDQAPLGHWAAMIRRRDDIPEEDMPPRRRFAFTAPLPGCDVAESFVAAARAPRSQYDFVDTVEAGHGLIRSPGHNARTIARAADRVKDVGYDRALQASERRMMTSIEEVNLRVTYQAQIRRQESKYFYTQLHDAQTDRRDIRLEIDVVRVNQMMRIHALEARAQTDTVEDADSSCHDAAYAMTWGTLKKKITNKYCPKALMSTKFLADETEKVDKYISGLPDNIHGNVMSARPNTLNETIKLANDLVNQKLRNYVERQNENKRKTDNNQQQQPHKKQNVARAYTTGPGEKKVYIGDLPLCTKCNYHHTRQCAPKCGKCKRIHHLLTHLYNESNDVGWTKMYGDGETEEHKPIISLFHGSSLTDKLTKEQRSG